MSRNLLKKVGALEDELWAKTKLIRIALEDELEEFTKAAFPLDSPIFHAWLAINLEAQKREDRALQIAGGLPRIHPAFLPGEGAVTRRYQWALHHSKEYRELAERQMADFLPHVRESYDLTAGILAIALRVFSGQLDEMVALQDYIGFALTREDLADCMIRQRHHAYSLAEEYDDSDAAWNEIWCRARVEVERELYDRTMTTAEVEAEQAMWRQVTEDMKAGRPAGEVAAHLRAICEQYPRRVAVGEWEQR
jgi:hypothetical protein